MVPSLLPVRTWNEYINQLKPLVQGMCERTDGFFGMELHAGDRTLVARQLV